MLKAAFPRRGKVVVSTFHGLGLNLLKPWLSLLCRDAGYNIPDGDEKFSLLQGSYRCPETVLQASSQVLGNGQQMLSGQWQGINGRE